MATEQLTYAQIAERLGASVEAARAIVTRHHLPRSRSNDGKTLVSIDVKEIQHRRLPARSPGNHRADRLAATESCEAHPARSNGISILLSGGLTQSLTQAEGGAWRKMTNSPNHCAVKFTAH